MAVLPSTRCCARDRPRFRGSGREGRPDAASSATRSGRPLRRRPIRRRALDDDFGEALSDCRRHAGFVRSAAVRLARRPGDVVSDGGDAGEAIVGPLPSVVARLRDGVTPRQAQAEMRAIASQRENETPDDKGWSATVVPLKEELTADARTTLFVLLGAVSLLLIMAVTNVATLTTSATWQRGAELAVRRAIGATDARLFRQLFVQSALWRCSALPSAWRQPRRCSDLVTLLPPETPRLIAVRVDCAGLVVTTIAILATLIATRFDRGDRRTGFGRRPRTSPGCPKARAAAQEEVDRC